MLKKLSSKTFLVFLIIFAIGIFLRVYQFPNIPPGVNQDEAAAAYEAYSILETGKDKWGNSYPVYLPAWGSGQNALFSYILVPFIATFGLNIFALRLPSLIFGILLLPLVFLLVRKLFGSKTALISTLLLAILPWHVMMSRWSLESNILPFFFALGLLLLAYGFSWKEEKLRFTKKFVIAISLIPFALCFYCYSLSLFVIPVFLGIVFWFNRKTFFEHKKLWLTSLSLFLLLALPIGLFILKNNILKTSLPLENLLPFSIPLFPSSRVSQITEIPYLQMLSGNIWFLFAGFNDNLSWNVAGFYLPLSPFIYIFFLISLIKNLKDLRLGKVNLIFAALLAYFVPFLLVPLNVNRFNAGLLMVLIMSAEGIYILTKLVNQHFNLVNNKKYLFPIFTFLLFAIYSISFANFYFGNYSRQVREGFNYGIEEAISFAEQNSSSEKIYLSTHAPINYVYYLFWTKSDPADFQENANVEVKNGGYEVNNYKNIYFTPDYFRNIVKNDQSYLVILKVEEKDFCENQTLIFENDIWRVGRCGQLSDSQSTEQR